MRAHARSRKLASDEKDSCSEILSDMPPSTGGRNEAVAERGEESTADCKDADIDEGGAETGRFHHGGSFSDGESDNGARPTKTGQAVPSHAKSRQHGRSSHSSSRSGRSSVDSDKGARVVAAAVAVRLGQGEESGVAVTDAAIGEEKLGTGASSDDENTAGCVSRRTSEDTL